MDSSRIVDLEQTSVAQQRHLERLEGQVTTLYQHAVQEARQAQDTAFKAHIKARSAAAIAQWAASEAKRSADLEASRQA
eukprot:3690568-Alexandrium_andersonii.AAC.1